MIPCRCAVLNTLTGSAAEDYVRQHLDVEREDGTGRMRLSCPETDVVWVLEPTPGAYGDDEQRRLRRG